MFAVNSLEGRLFVVALIAIAFCAGFVAGYATCRVERGGVR